MRHRAVLLVAVTSLCFALTAAPALAWQNGGDERNGFGTHDWVLDNAIDTAGSRGAWVDRTTALLATDDPDSYNYDQTYHAFRDKTGSRGAAQEVADQYFLAVEAYRAGDVPAASYHLGLLAHYYADICQPYHSSYDGIGAEGHALYESGIGDLTHTPGAQPSWSTPRDLKAVTDVRAKTVAAAAYARSKFPALLKDLKAHGSVRTTTVMGITDAVLTRGCNDLADIVAGIPDAAGLAPAPTRLKAWMYRYYPARNGKACIYAKCLDANGQPMEGVKLFFSWPTASGTKTYRVYTGPTGVAYKWINTGDVPLMAKTPVNVTTTSSGLTKTTATWFMATPKLADGSSGIKTYLSDHTPRQYSDVTVRTVVRDTAGRPVVGLPVVFTWKHYSKTVTYRTLTNSRGVAQQTRNIGGSAKGYRVYVRAQTQAAGINRSSTSSFVPW